MLPTLSKAIKQQNTHFNLRARTKYSFLMSDESKLSKSAFQRYAVLLPLTSYYFQNFYFSHPQNTTVLNRPTHRVSNIIAYPIFKMGAFENDLPF